MNGLPREPYRPTKGPLGSPPTGGSGVPRKPSVPHLQGSDPEVQSISFKGSMLEVDIKNAPGFEALVSTMVGFLDAQRALNYVEMSIRDGRGRAVVLAACRSEGQTPHALRLKAEAERDALAAVVGSFLNSKGHLVYCPDCALKPDQRVEVWQANEYGHVHGRLPGIQLSIDQCEAVQKALRAIKTEGSA